MSKSIAKLYKYAILQNRLQIVENREKILHDLELYPVKSVKQLIKKYNLSNLQLEELCIELYSEYESFVDSKFQSNGKSFPLLISELKSIGYSSDKINLLDLEQRVFLNDDFFYKIYSLHILCLIL